MESDQPLPPLRIWIDGDACPAAIKNLIYKAAKRLSVAVTLVANQSMHVPKSVELMVVAHGANLADDKIIELMESGQVVVTGDIPLAARVVDKGGIAIGTRGELYDDDSVHERLASRDLMEQFRSAGVDTRGPKPLDPKDVQSFANMLDRTLTKLLKSN